VKENSPIEYKLKVSKQARRLSLRYDHRGLHIISPRSISKHQAQELIRKHLAWVLKQQTHYAQISVQKLYDGAEVDIFGDREKIRYVLEENSAKVAESGEHLVVKAAAGEHQKVLTKWLRQIAKRGIIARVSELAVKHGFKYQNISIRDQSSRWGSCSSQANLNFNWRLMLAPLFVLDYVIIHELAHTQQMNHSSAFWEIVANCMPDYRLAKKWLKSEGKLLHQY